MILHWEGILSEESRAADAVDELLSSVRATDGVTILHAIISENVGENSYIILEVSYKSTPVTQTSKAYTLIGQEPIDVVATWSKKYIGSSYSLSINDFSIVDLIISNIKDKTRDTLLKKIIVASNTRTLVGRFNLEDIPINKETLELL